MHKNMMIKSVGISLVGIVTAMAQPTKPLIPTSPSASYVASTPTQKSPYQAERVYKIRAIPGSPVMVELPMGETPENIWYDKQWWKAESTPGSNRLVIQALAADGVYGRKSNIHVETSPSNLRISLQVEAVREDQDPPSVVTLYMDGTDLETAARVQAASKAMYDTAQYRKKLEADARAEYEAWKNKAVTSMSQDYVFSHGDLGLEKVVSDGNQTWIYTKTTEQAALKLKNRDGVEETLNYEVKDGTFIVNHVLMQGEAFILVVGKKTTKIQPK